MNQPVPPEGDKSPQSNDGSFAHDVGRPGNGCVGSLVPVALGAAASLLLALVFLASQLQIAFTVGLEVGLLVVLLPVTIGVVVGVLLMIRASARRRRAA